MFKRIGTRLYAALGLAVLLTLLSGGVGVYYFERSGDLNHRLVNEAFPAYADEPAQRGRELESRRGVRDHRRNCQTTPDVSSETKARHGSLLRKKPDAHTYAASEAADAHTDRVKPEEKRANMRMYPREFLATRLKMPKRRAERQVYEALATTISEGFCYYEWRKGHEQMELDFATWIVGLGRFALQVKGGHYLLVDGDWRLQTRGGLKPIVSCPLDQAKIAALDLHDDIKERAQTDYNPFVIPVLVFPDMDGDPDIDRLAGRRGVYVVWGTANLSAALEGIVAGRSVRPSLDSARIAREVRAVTDGLIRLCEPADAPAPTGNNGETVVPPVSRKASVSLKVGGVDVFNIEAGALRVRMTTPKTRRRRPRR